MQKNAESEDEPGIEQSDPIVLAAATPFAWCTRPDGASSSLGPSQVARTSDRYLRSSPRSLRSQTTTGAGKGGAMRRGIYSGVFLLALSGIAVGTPLAASASTAAQKHAHTVQCSSVATGHKKATNAGIAACTSSTLAVTRPCPKGSTIFVVSKGTTYALRSGAKPVRLPKNASLIALNKACGLSTTPTPVAQALPAPTTTTLPPTTVPPPPPSTTTIPPTTVPPPPPPTTAAPASCYPMTDGGNCYEPGEYCRDSDHGASGVAGDGKAITCADNDGWRWEPT